MSLNKIQKKDIGSTIIVLARIESVFQTAGPTIFLLYDGSGKINAKAFASPGKRAFESFDKGDIVEVTMKIQEYEGNVEGSILNMEKKLPETFEQQLAQHHEKKIKVENTQFLAQSEVLTKLEEQFKAAAKLIKESIFDERPIIVRHNADCDGYSGALALERAITPLIKERHKDSYGKWKFYKRLPSKAPFYALSDSIIDLVSITNEIARYGSKPPLIIIVDNGSGKEDVVSIKNVKVYGCKVIVVDHHFFSEDHTTELVDVHINPYRVGGDSQICAGMLGVELARFINTKAHNIEYMAALAGIGDKVQGEEMNQYVKIAEQNDYDLNFLKKLALAVDFVAYHLRSFEGRYLVDDLFGFDKERQKKIVSLYHAHALKNLDRALEIVKKYTVIDEKDEKIVAQVDLTTISIPWEFPPFGKLTGLASDWLNQKHEKPVYVMGISNDMVILRVSKSELHFNLNNIVTKLKKEKLYAAISGGGHERAGTIKFAPAAKDEVVSFVKECIDKKE